MILCILPTNIVDIAICYTNIRFAQSTTQTLIGGELKTTLADVAVWINRRRVWRWADLSLDVSLVTSYSCGWAFTTHIKAQYSNYYATAAPFWQASMVCSKNSGWWRTIWRTVAASTGKSCRLCTRFLNVLLLVVSASLYSVLVGFYSF